MPKLTPEELAEEQRKEFSPLGRALAMKFMERRIDGEELASELGRYGGDEAAIVKQALLSDLKGSLSLHDPLQNDRVFEALEALGQEMDPTGFRDGVRAVVGDYQKEKERIERQFAEEYRASLQRRGVSGSALRPNLGDSRGLKKRLQEPDRDFGRKLDELMDRYIKA
jgi:hypothetical protein